MIEIKEVDKSYFPQYDEVTQNVEVESIYAVKRIDSGLGGFIFEEEKVTPYIKDLSVYERAVEYEKTFDISNWRFYMAFDGDVPVGAMTVAGTTENLNMLFVERTPAYYGIYALLIHISIRESDKDLLIWELKERVQTDIS